MSGTSSRARSATSLLVSFSSRYALLPSLRQHVDGPVLVHGEVHAVRGGRRAELVHLFLQRGDLLARLVERIDELFILVAEVSLDFLCLDVPLSDAVERRHGSLLIRSSSVRGAAQTDLARRRNSAMLASVRDRRKLIPSPPSECRPPLHNVCLRVSE